MLRKSFFVGLCLSLMCLSWGLASPVPKPKEIPKEQQANSNEIVKKFAGQIQIDASSTWGGYPAQNLLDGKLDTVWYSENGDCRAKERQPSLTITLPEAVAVTRVTAFGNRDPQFPVGYGILEAQLLLIDADGRTVTRITRECRGERKDFDFLLSEPSPRVKVIKLLVLRDETSGSSTSVACVALSELRVE
jgi:hypothetical protein